LQRWLGELAAFALRQGDLTDRTLSEECIYRRYQGQRQELRPLGIFDLAGIVVCMTSSEGLVAGGRSLKADSSARAVRPYRPGRNCANRRWSRWERCSDHGPPGSRRRPTPRGLLREHSRTPELLKSVARRIVDRRVLHLIKDVCWIAPWKETRRSEGRKTRMTECPGQTGAAFRKASPISPLLAKSVHMRRFVLGWKMLGLERRPRLLAS